MVEVSCRSMMWAELLGSTVEELLVKFRENKRDGVQIVRNLEAANRKQTAQRSLSYRKCPPEQNQGRAQLSERRYSFDERYLEQANTIQTRSFETWSL